MGKKRRILLAALLVVLLSGFAWRLLRPSEPSYNGKPLSAWLKEFSPDFGYSKDVKEALCSMGTNAFPTLFRMLRASDSPLKTKFIELLGRETSARIKITPAVDRNFEARFAFRALGADASNAVPQLLQIYAEKISLGSQCQTVASFGEIGPAAKPAIPTLLGALKTTNKTVRWYAVLALGQIHGEPELVVPELVKLLHDSDRLVSRFAVEAAGNFGTNAESAVPDLTVMLNDRDLRIREAATNALKQIDSEAAAKAGVK